MSSGHGSGYVPKVLFYSKDHCKGRPLVVGPTLVARIFEFETFKIRQHFDFQFNEVLPQSVVVHQIEFHCLFNGSRNLNDIFELGLRGIPLFLLLRVVLSSSPYMS
jgi:hypothetical protein